MPVKSWWDSDEYARNLMVFPDLRGGPVQRLGKTEPEYVDGRWVSTPIQVYVGPSHF